MTTADLILQGKADIDAVHAAGYAKGLAVGGGDDYYDKFWDVMQAKGERVNYMYAFAYDRFSDEIYSPKYPINTKSGTTPSRYMFYQSSGITDTKVPIYANGGDVNYAFQGCTSLVTIRELKVLSTQSLTSTFAGCTALENITITGTIGNNISFFDSPNLTLASLTSIINALETKTDGGTYTLTLNSTAKARLTDELKQIVADKGWRIQ